MERSGDVRCSLLLKQRPPFSPSMHPAEWRVKGFFEGQSHNLDVITSGHQNRALEVPVQRAAAMTPFLYRCQRNGPIDRLAHLILLLSIITSTALAAAPPRSWHVRSWKVGDGLPDNAVRSMTQTKDGRLWIVTDGSLVSYDGLSFRELPEGVKSRLMAARVEHVLGGREGELWLATRLGGLFKWHHATLTPMDGEAATRSKTNVTALCEDGVGNVWIGRRGLIERHHDRSVEVMKVPSQSTPEPIVTLAAAAAGDRVWAVCGAHAGWCGQGELPRYSDRSSDYPVVIMAAADSASFWIGRETALEKIDWRTGSISLQAALPGHSGNLTAAIGDGRKGVWFGSFTHGLHHWNGTCMEQIEGVPSGVRCLCLDHEGSVWVGTEGQGLLCVRPRRTTVHQMPAEHRPPQVVSVSENNSGVLSIAAVGLRLYRSTGAQWNLVPTPGMEEGQEFRCVLPEAEDGWWLGRIGAGVYHQAQAGGRWMRIDEGLASKRVRCLFRDKADRLWVGTDDGISFWNGRRFESALQGDEMRVMCFASDRRSRIWLGTMTGRVLCVEGSPPRVVDEVQGLPGAAIHALLATDHDELWIGSEGAGLFLRQSSGSLGSIKAKHGLPGNSVLSILEARSGLLALGTQRGIGLARVDDLTACASGRQSRINVCVIGAGEGLEDAACSIGGQPTAVKRQSGTLVFATSSGAVEFDPSDAIGTLPPCKLAVESLESDGQSLSASSAGVECYSNHKPVNLHLLAPTFCAPELLRIRYRVDGQQAAWSQLAGSRALPLNASQPGRYTVRVQASNNELTWEEPGLVVAWVVHPHFWQTAWFHFVLVAILFSVVFMVWKRMATQRLRAKLTGLENEKALSGERARIARDMHDAIGARLTQLSLLHDMALSAPELPASLRDKLQRATSSAHEVALAMDEIVWSINPRNDTLGELINYLTHVTSEYLEPLGMVCRFEITPDIPAQTIHSRVRHAVLHMVKECLQNVAKHSHAHAVTLRIRITDASLDMTVIDDGIGPPDEIAHEGGHDGLQNLRDRTSALGGSFTLQRGSPCGTQAHITIPRHRLS